MVNQFGRGGSRPRCVLLNIVIRSPTRRSTRAGKSPAWTGREQRGAPHLADDRSGHQRRLPWLEIKRARGARRLAMSISAPCLCRRNGAQSSQAAGLSKMKEGWAAPRCYSLLTAPSAATSLQPGGFFFCPCQARRPARFPFPGPAFEIRPVPPAGKSERPIAVRSFFARPGGYSQPTPGLCSSLTNSFLDQSLGEQPADLCSD
jgi:hypothetical protein